MAFSTGIYKALVGKYSDFDQLSSLVSDLRLIDFE